MTVIDWLVWSSKDPAKVSLTVRGALLSIVPFLMMAVGIANIDIGPDRLTAIFESVAEFVQVGLSIVAMAMTGYGILRKLWLTIKTHQDTTWPQE